MKELTNQFAWTERRATPFPKISAGSVIPVRWLFALVFLLWLPAGTAIAADSSSLDEMLQRLNSTQEQFVKDELTRQLPSLASNEADKELAQQLISDIKRYGALLDEIREGNYLGLGGAVAEHLGTLIEDEIKARYPEGSMVRSVADSVKEYGDLYKRMGQAVLSADSRQLEIESKEVLAEYARRRTTELQKKGQEVWKDLIREIINPPEALSKIGVDPVDLYIQGVEDWTDFLKKTGKRYHRAVFDCYYDRYEKAISSASPDTVRDELTLLGLKGHRCGEKEPRDSLPSQISNFIKNLTSGTSTLAEFKLSREQLLDLLEAYHKQRDTNAPPRFGAWLEDRFNKLARRKKEKVQTALEAEQRNEAENSAVRARRKAFADRMEKALEAALRKVLGEEAPKTGAGAAGTAGTAGAAQQEGTRRTSGAARDRAEEPVDTQAAETALQDCKFKDSRKLIQALPEGPRRTELVNKWNEAYETERKARDLIKEAVALKRQGEPSKAIGKLHTARDLQPCESTVTAIDKAVVDIQSGIDTAKAASALEACKFDDSRKLIQALPEGPRRTELVNKWNKAYETERKARDLVKEAMALKNQGEPSKAIGKLHVARDLQPCDSTVTAIDNAVVAINSQLPNNSAECLRIVGRWDWFTGNVADFFNDNTWRASNGDTGRWSCQSDNAIVVTPNVGTWRDTVRISSDGASLSGSNEQGVKVTAGRSGTTKKGVCPPGYNPYGC